jgi:peroxiredoxin
MNKSLIFIAAAVLAPTLLLAMAAKPQIPRPDVGLAVGDKAPALQAQDEAGHAWDLSAALKKGPVILLFNRGHWCPVCQNELKALQAEILPQATAQGVEIIVVSVDSPEQNLKTRVKFGYEFTLLSAGESQLEAYRVLNAEAKSKPRYAHPGVFALSQDGVVRWARADKDYRKRASLAQWAEALEKLKP